MDFQAIDEGENHFMVRNAQGQEIAVPKQMLTDEHQKELRSTIPPKEDLVSIEPRNMDPAANFTPTAGRTQATPEGIEAFDKMSMTPPAPKSPVPDQTVPTIPPAATGMGDYQKAWNQQLAGIQQSAEAQSRGQEALAKAAEAQETAIRETQDYYAKKRASLDAETEQLQKDVSESKIDPNRFWNEKTGIKGGAAKVLSFIGLFLGGMSQSRGAGNPAQQMLDKAMEEDIDAQKSEMGKKQNLLRMNMDKYGNLQQAEIATRLDMANMFSAQMQKIGAQTQSEAVKANALQMTGALQANIAQMKDALAMQDTMRKVQGAISGGGQIPDQLVAMLPKEQKETLVKLPTGQWTQANTKEDADKIKEIQPKVQTIQKILEEMKNFKGTSALPNVLAMGDVTPTGHAGEVLATQLKNEIRGIGAALRISEFTNDAFLDKLAPNPAQWKSGVAKHTIESTEKYIRDKLNAEYASRLITFNPASVPEQPY